MYEQGNYWCKITNQQLGESKEKKTPQWVLTFDVVGKINPADPEGELIGCDQYERSIFRVITDKTVDYLIEDVKRLCERAGIKPVLLGFEYLDPKTPGFLDFKDVEFEAYCKHDTYEGKTREQWGISRGSKGLEVTPLDDNGVRNLNAMFGRHLKSLGGGSTQRPMSRSAPASKADAVASGVHPDSPPDDIPF